MRLKSQVAALSELRDKPAGTIRIVASDYAIKSVLWPKLRNLLPKYPDIKVELSRDNGLTDIVTQRYDAGVRMGEQLAKDMISVRIGPDIRFAVVGTPSYFKKNPEPSCPQDLVRHNCITERHATSGGIWAWEFAERGREIKIRVDGQLVFNNSYDVVDAALDGVGLAYVPEEIVRAHIAKGRLTHVLEKWSPSWDGYHLYYPSRRQSSPAFLAVVGSLRYRT